MTVKYSPEAERELAEMEKSYNAMVGRASTMSDAEFAQLVKAREEAKEQKKLEQKNKDKKPAKDLVVATIAEQLSERSTVISIPDNFGEVQVYSGKRQSGYDRSGPVVFWEKDYRGEIDRAVYYLIKEKCSSALPPTANNVKMVVDTLLLATNIGRGVDGERFVMVTSEEIDNTESGNGEHLEPTYFDIKTGKLLTLSEIRETLSDEEWYRYTTPEGELLCLHRFCNSKDGEARVPVIAEGDIDLDLVKKHYNLAYNEIGKWVNRLDDGSAKKNYIYGVRFESTFMDWACGDMELYVDILTMCATPLMKKKPECSFFIRGGAANGKTALRHLMMSLYGSRNMSSVQISQMGDWSYAGTLQGSLLNFPDEERTGIAGMDKDVFKSLASHDSVMVRKKGSSVPFDIKANFMSIIPINETPKWDGMDGGVARRIMIVPFNADHSGDAQGGISFEEKEYTPELVSRLMGELMGIAAWYTQHPEAGIRWGTQVTQASGEWNTENDNVKLFLMDFERVYHGFASMNLLYEVYQKWCEVGEYKWASRDRLKDVFMRFNGYNQRARYRGYNVYKKKGSSCPEDWALREDGYVLLGNEGHVTIRECLNRGQDPVTCTLLANGMERADGC